MTDSTNTSSSYGWLVILLIFIVVLGVMFGGVNGFGNRSVSVAEGCSVTSNCQVEKQTIINTATTQNLINQQAEATRAQASRIYEAQQAEKIFDLKLDAHTNAILNGQEKIALKAENDQLKQTIYLNAKFNETDKQFAYTNCRLLPKPELYGVAATYTGQVIPPLSE